MRAAGPAKLLHQEPHSASQHPAAVALNCVCEHLGFLSIYVVHPLASCVSYKVSEKPKGAREGVKFPVKLDVIKHFDCGE